MNYMILVSVVLPVLVGFILLFLPERVLENRQHLLKVTGVSFFGVCTCGSLYNERRGGEQAGLI